MWAVFQVYLLTVASLQETMTIFLHLRTELLHLTIAKYLCTLQHLPATLI